MRFYTFGWRLVAAVTTGVAGLSLVTTAGWGPTVMTVAAVALLAGVLSHSWREAFGPASMSVLGWTVGSVAGTLIFVGLPLSAGRAAFVVLAVLGITRPPLVRRLIRRRVRRLHGPPAPDAVPLPDPLLALAWFDTTRRLRAATTPADALAVVEERARFLDNLEQRDPDAFQAWLSFAAA